MNSAVTMEGVETECYADGSEEESEAIGGEKVEGAVVVYVSGGEEGYFDCGGVWGAGARLGGG